MMTMTTIDMMRTHRRAEDLAEKVIDFVTQYIAEVASDEPVEVQQLAIHMAGRMLAPATNGTCFVLPPLEEV